jgi:hypothetical protein
MAADNMRTLLWMTSERESRKLENLHASKDLLSSILNDIQNGRLDDNQIDHAIQLVSDMNIGEPINDIDLKSNETGIIEYISPNTELDVKADNYVPKIQKNSLKEIIPYRSQAKNDTNEFDGLDFEDGDVDSPPDESENEISEDDEEESEGHALFVNKEGENFHGHSAVKPSTILDEKNVSPQDIVALIYDS